MSTLKNFRSGYQPSIADWNNYDGWQKSKEPDIERRAQQKAKEIIENAKPLLDPSTADALKEFIGKCE